MFNLYFLVVTAFVEIAFAVSTGATFVVDVVTELLVMGVVFVLQAQLIRAREIQTIMNRRIDPPCKSLKANS
jgi:hypothetical protein